MISMVKKKAWNYFTVDWFLQAENEEPIWTRLTFCFSVGWHCWGLGVATRVYPPTEYRKVALALGPMMVEVGLWPKPSPFCDCCGQRLTVPNEDCLAHPVPEVTR
jgi:hypothetical protein